MSCQQFNLHTERKQKVLSLLEHSIEVLKDAECIEEVNALQVLSQDVVNNRFSIVVVGQFSAGKSTFLNALMGEKYLPSFQNETTATINFLESVDENNGKNVMIVKYRNGNEVKEDDVNLKTIETYVSTKGEKVAQNIEYVTLFLNSPFLKEHVTLVDSPGLGGILEHHENITRDQIKKSHAAIFMFSANQPGSKADFKFLQTLKKECKSTLIVLNQIDNIKESENCIEDVTETLRGNYANVFPDDPLPEIWPIASYPALVARSKEQLDYHNEKDFNEQKRAVLLAMSRFEKFENRLFDYLTNGEKTKQELLAPVLKAKRALEQTKQNIEDEITTLESNSNGQQIKEQIDELNKEIKEVEQKNHAKQSDLTSEINKLIRDTKNTILSESLEIRNKYIQRFEQAATADGELEDLQHDYVTYIARMNAEFNQAFINAYEEAQNSYEEITTRIFEDIATDIVSKLQVGSDVNLRLNFKIDSSYFELDVNDSVYVDKAEAIQDKIDELEVQSDSYEQKIAESEENQRRKELLGKKISQTQSERTSEIQSLGGRPVATHRMAYRTEKDGGLKGFIKWIWNGNPGKEVSYQVEDFAAIDRYDTNIKEIKEQYDAEIAQYREQLQQIGNTESSKYRVIKEQLDRKIERQRDCLEKLRKQQNESIQKEKRRAIRKAQDYISDCAQEIFDQTRKQVIEQLHEGKELMIKEAISIIQKSLEKSLAVKKMELEKQNLILEKGDKEVNAKVNEDRQLLDRIIAVLQEQVECENMLNNIEVDIIKEHIYNNSK